MFFLVCVLGLLGQCSVLWTPFWSLQRSEIYWNTSVFSLSGYKVLNSASPRSVMRNGFRKQYPEKLFHHPLLHLCWGECSIHLPSLHKRQLFPAGIKWFVSHFICKKGCFLTWPHKYPSSYLVPSDPPEKSPAWVIQILGMSMQEQVETLCTRDFSVWFSGSSCGIWQGMGSSCRRGSAAGDCSSSRLFSDLSASQCCTGTKPYSKKFLISQSDGSRAWKTTLSSDFSSGGT